MQCQEYWVHSPQSVTGLSLWNVWNFDDDAKDSCLKSTPFSLPQLTGQNKHVCLVCNENVVILALRTHKGKDRGEAGTVQNPPLLSLVKRNPYWNCLLFFSKNNITRTTRVLPSEALPVTNYRKSRPMTKFDAEFNCVSVSFVLCLLPHSFQMAFMQASTDMRGLRNACIKPFKPRCMFTYRQIYH